MERRCAVGIALISLLFSACSHTATCGPSGTTSAAPCLSVGPGWEEEARSRLIEATVALLDDDGDGLCTGVLAERSDLVVTAAHCLRGRGDRPVVLKLSSGEQVTGGLIASDRSSDVAIVRLEVKARLRPLPVAGAGSARPGDRIFFLGLPGPNRRVQDTAVARRAQCPSLPEVADAIFSKYHGHPGDSGAPIVSRQGIVGLVHGGARCEIAVPAHRIRAVLRRISP